MKLWQFKVIIVNPLINTLISKINTQSKYFLEIKLYIFFFQERHAVIVNFTILTFMVQQMLEKHSCLKHKKIQEKLIKNQNNTPIN